MTAPIGATWDEFDMDGATWIVPAERMKMKSEHVVPLSKQALAILREVRALGGGSRDVFPGRNQDKPVSNNTMLFALCRLCYKGKTTGKASAPWLQRCSTNPASGSTSSSASSGTLSATKCAPQNHRAGYLPERRAMMRQWADTLDALAVGAKVIPLQRRASGK